MKNLIEDILALKKKKKAVILAHNYQKPEIFEIADFLGDSLGLCREAAKTDAEIIVFCGVYFMAESAAILNPGKKVLVPNLEAGCAMADMIEAKQLVEFKKLRPNAAVVCYVNSTAEVKAVSDICCTSSNAVAVVKSLPNKEIIFVPDKNLAAYVAKFVPEKVIIPWEGYCPIHNYLTPEYVAEVKRGNPNAKVIAHPECPPDVLEVADYVSSTSGMIECAERSEAQEFFVLTECGMTERLKRSIPEKKFIGLCNMCYDMKRNDLESVYECLLNEKNVVKVDTSISKKALLAFEKMFNVKS